MKYKEIAREWVGNDLVIYYDNGGKAVITNVDAETLLKLNMLNESD